MSGLAIKITVAEDSPTVSLSSNNMVHHSDNKIPHHPNHEDIESKLDASPEEIITILEVIAATGNFWHDWDALKNMMSFQLKQVLAEYPQARMNKEMQQSSLSGETYLELVNRLNEGSDEERDLVPPPSLPQKEPPKAKEIETVVINEDEDITIKEERSSSSDGESCTSREENY